MERPPARCGGGRRRTARASCPAVVETRSRADRGPAGRGQGLEAGSATMPVPVLLPALVVMVMDHRGLLVGCRHRAEDRPGTTADQRALVAAEQVAGPGADAAPDQRTLLL